jgi:hypothetical protein
MACTPVTTFSPEQQTSAPLHVSLPHSMLGPAQLPAPSHRPPWPQRVLAERKPQSWTDRQSLRPLQTLRKFWVLVTQSASKLLHVTLPQAVSVAAAPQNPVEHSSHTPLQAELQHTPSTQLPLAHSPPTPHASPFPCFGSEQLPALSQRFRALQAWPALRGAPWHSCAAEPQAPAMQRPAVTLGGKLRQVVSAGQAIAPQVASSWRLVQAVPVALQTRQAPLQAAVQQTLPPVAVSWHVPCPQSVLALHACPAPAKQPSRCTLQPSVPHASSVTHWPAAQR